MAFNSEFRSSDNLDKTTETSCIENLYTLAIQKVSNSKLLKHALPGGNTM